MKNSRKYKSIIALVAVLATVFLVHFSNLYISEHAGHKCEDQAHCPVCAVINLCDTNLKTIGTGLILAAAITLIFSFVLSEAVNYVYQSVQTTLVSQKVRLDS